MKKLPNFLNKYFYLISAIIILVFYYNCMNFTTIKIIGFVLCIYMIITELTTILKGEK